MLIDEELIIDHTTENKPVDGRGLGRIFAFDPRDRRHLATPPPASQIEIRKRHWSVGKILDQGSEPQCFPPNIKILMGDGSEKPIQDIKVGDNVVTHTGAIMPVTELFVRDYEGEIASVYVRGNQIPLMVTPEHPFLAAKVECSTVMVKAAGSDLLIRDRKRRVDRKQWLGISDFRLYEPESSYDAVCVYTGSPNPLVRDGDLIDLSVFVDTENIQVTEDSLLGKSFNSKKKIPRRIKASKDFARIIGLYLAEGHTRQRMCSIGFSFHSKETNFIEETLTFFKNVFGVEGKATITGNSARVVFYSSVLAYLFKGLGGLGSNEKSLNPKIFTWSNDLLKYIWEGHLDGDGHVRFSNEGHKRTDLITVSENLANDLFRIGLRLKLSPTLTTSQPKISHNVKSRKRRYDVNVYDSPKSVRRIIDGDYLISAVKTIKYESYKGKVYNFEVEGDHSYITNSIAVHNCVAYTGEQLLASSPVRNKYYKTPAELYKACQIVDEWPGEDYGGTSVRALFRVFREVGYVESWQNAFEIDTVIRHVLTSSPVALGTTWGNSMFYPFVHRGEKFIKYDAVAGNAGGHAYLLSGINLDKSCFCGDKGSARITNSWSKEWGDNGKVWMCLKELSILIADDGEAITSKELKFTPEN